MKNISQTLINSGVGQDKESIRVLFVCLGNICTLPYKQDKLNYL